MFRRRKKSTPGNEQIPVRDYQAVAVTDTGCTRMHNEDAVRFVRPSGPGIRKNMGFLAIVADGMGGHASGEVASTIAVEIITEEYYNSRKKPVKALKIAGEKANEEIWRFAKQDKKLRGMGTTCTAVALVQDKLFIFHIGDSRAYLFKEGNIIRLTEDHTYVQQLINSGEITPFAARNHPDGNILTKSLGTAKKRSCDIFLSEYRFEEGDKLLLCSDGLYEYFTANELAEFLAEEDLSLISQKLTVEVTERGAHDNFTLLLVEARKEVPVNNLPTRAVTLEL